MALWVLYVLLVLDGTHSKLLWFSTFWKISLRCRHLSFSWFFFNHAEFCRPFDSWHLFSLGPWWWGTVFSVLCKLTVMALGNSVHASCHCHQHEPGTLECKLCVSGDLSRPMEFSLLFKWEADCHFECLPGDSLSMTSLKRLWNLCRFLLTVKEYLFVLSVVFVTSVHSGPSGFPSVLLSNLPEASGPADLCPDAQVSVRISAAHSEVQNCNRHATSTEPRRQSPSHGLFHFTDFVSCFCEILWDFVSCRSYLGGC